MGALLLCALLLGCDVDLVTDGGLEAGSPAWQYAQFGGTAERTNAYDAHAGDWAGYLEGGVAGLALIGQELAAAAPLPARHGYIVEAWVRQLVPGVPLIMGLGNAGAVAPVWMVATDDDVRVYVDQGGAFVLFASWPADPSAWLKLSLLLPAAAIVDLVGEDGNVLFGVDESAPATFPGVSYTAGGAWLVDDVGVFDMSLTALLEADLLTDLATIATPAYDTDVAQVSADPEDEQHATLPAILLEPDEGGEADIDELGDRTGIATQEWTLKLLVRGTNYRTALQDLLDDVRNVVATGTLNARPNLKVIVTNWTAPLVGADIAHQRAKLTARVTAEYTYVRGAL